MAKTRKKKLQKRKTRQRGGFQQHCYYANQVHGNTDLPVRWEDYDGGSHILREIDELPKFSKRSRIQLGIDYIWVITVDDPWTIYYTDPNPGDLEPGEDNYFAPDGSATDFIKHSHVAMGGDVHCAGTLRAENHGGFHLYITNQSGHYRPAQDCLEDTSEWMEEEEENGDRQPYDALEVFRDYGYQNIIVE